MVTSIVLVSVICMVITLGVSLSFNNIFAQSLTNGTTDSNQNIEHIPVSESGENLFGGAFVLRAVTYSIIGGVIAIIGVLLWKRKLGRS